MDDSISDSDLRFLPNSPTGLSGEDAFQYAMRFTSPYRDWYRDFNARFGEPPNLDTTDYDTRGAWLYGVQPEPYIHDDGHYHWSSTVTMPPHAQQTELKSEEHPTRWMQTFMERYGADPYEASEEQLGDALRTGIVPLRDEPSLYDEYVTNDRLREIADRINATRRRQLP